MTALFSSYGGYSARIYCLWSIVSPVHLSMLRLLITIGRWPNHFNSSSNGLRWLEQWMNSTSSKSLCWVVHPSIRTMTSLGRGKCQMLPLWRQAIEGAGLDGRQFPSSCRNPDSGAFTLENIYQLVRNKYNRDFSKSLDQQSIAIVSQLQIDAQSVRVK